jgi:acyl-CoA hydrolase
VIKVGNTSLQVQVDVFVENMYLDGRESDPRVFSFVAIDEDKRPVPVLPDFLPDPEPSRREPPPGFRFRSQWERACSRVQSPGLADQCQQGPARWFHSSLRRHHMHPAAVITRTAGRPLAMQCLVGIPAKAVGQRAVQFGAVAEQAGQLA